jgi:signal transduction histidine kinase
VRLWRGLGTRIVIGSILCGILGLAVAVLFMRRTAREAMQIGFAPYVRRALDRTEVDRCEHAPERWSLALTRDVRIDAYDERTLASQNPESPPLDPGLYRRLENAEPSPVRFHRFGASEEGATMLLRVAPAGPCALMQVTWPPHTSRRRRFFYFILTGALLVITAAAALGVLFVLQPLTRRIGKLRSAAGAVGSSTGYVSARDAAQDELGELSTSLDVAHDRIRSDAERLEERQRALERYLGDVAHDLKTPIASLQMSLEHAANTSRDAALSELLKSSLKDVIYLGALTNNLRLACQLREGWDPAAGDPSVDLGATIDRVVERTRYFAKNRGIALDSARPDVPVLVRCQTTAAEQAITNLVENAIAYGDPGGHVAVVLETDQRDFVLGVEDDGPGVLPAELPRLGERTFRSDEARQRDPSGSGLGLAITQEICQRCSFALSFERLAPRGLRVQVTGPILSSPPPDAHLASTSPSASTPSPVTPPPR